MILIHHWFYKFYTKSKKKMSRQKPKSRAVYTEKEQVLCATELR